ncbi:hypothetical protein HK102_005364 [Quaeritorhiza haematococci]|nr:hypothetical protein HK102_005364 [Quaeritorhiza haematococci]
MGEQTLKLEFLAKYTGVSDSAKLTQHVLDVRERSKKQHHVYKCIEQFMFLEPRLPNHEVYGELIAALTKKAPSTKAASFLDVGCCFGTDVRRLIMDGADPSSLMGLDLHDGYWELGLDLYMDRDRPDAPIRKVHTAFGDFAIGMGGPGSLDLRHMSNSKDFICANAVLHVLSAEQTENMLRNVFNVLAPGGVFFGWTVGSLHPQDWAPTPRGEAIRFLHSVQSLTELMKKIGFVEVVVKAAELKADHGGQSANRSDKNFPPLNDNIRRLAFQARKQQ